jgi:ankyrin repeat protein/CRP-like cAMP-binding protein
MYPPYILSPLPTHAQSLTRTYRYGDFSPVGSAEQIWGIVYMLLNMVFAAWMIGSITLLIVKTDEETGHYRDTLKTLEVYSEIHGFDKPFLKRLKSQVKLYFSQRQVADEEVLKNFPTLTRRKVLKRLYLPSFLDSFLMKGIREQFLDAFLCCCRVEIFSPGEELLQRGSNSTELYLLVEGDVVLVPPIHGGDDPFADKDQLRRMTAALLEDEELSNSTKRRLKRLGPGHFVNDVSFFTQTPMTETVQTATICKTLTLPLSDYKMIAKDHPGSIAMVLENLLEQIQEEAELEEEANDAFDDTPNGSSSSSSEPMMNCSSKEHHEHVLQARQDLVRMHIHKLKDDQVARILFAASRGDCTTITWMCDQGFDPNSADYDGRTALMVASVKGCTEAVQKLLEYCADPNLVDVNGSTALFEAVRNGHENTMETLIEAGAQLCMDEAKAAAELIEAVSAGHMQTLQRLLKAKININASNFDQRTALHVAASKGNLAALKLLVEHGADIHVRDIWDNSVYDDAKNSKSEPVIQYVLSVDKDAKHSGYLSWR